jgi:hypothetical protein
VTITSVGRRAEKQIQLADINADYRDLDDGKIICGVITHPRSLSAPKNRADRGSSGLT